MKNSVSFFSNLASVKKTLIIIPSVTSAIIAAFVIFFFWASSKTLNKEEYKTGRIWKIPLQNEKKKSGQSFKIITYNMGYASGMANNLALKPGKDFYDKNLALICSALNKVNPDIVTLQEIDYESERSYNLNQAEIISGNLGLDHAAYLPNWNKRYLPFPYWPPSVHYGRVNSGQAVLSGYTIISQKRHTLPEPASNSFFYNAFYLERLLQETVISINGREIVVINVHLEAWDVKTREEHARILVALYRQISDKPVIIIGDFNSIPSYSSKLKNFPEGEPAEDYTNDKTISIVLAEKSLKMSIPEARYKKNEKLYFTYSSEKPYVSIDHIFYNEKIIPVKSDVIRDAGTGSDHYPVFFEFTLK